MAGFHTVQQAGAGSLGEQTYKPLLKPGLHKIIGFAQRTQGLMVARGNPRLHSLEQLADGQVRFVNRALGTARLLLDELLAQQRIARSRIKGYRHTELARRRAQAIAAGQADAGLGIEAAARARPGLRAPGDGGLPPGLPEVGARGAGGPGPVPRSAGAGLAWPVAWPPGYQPAQQLGQVLAMSRLLAWWKYRGEKKPKTRAAEGAARAQARRSGSRRRCRRARAGSSCGTWATSCAGAWPTRHRAAPCGCRTRARVVTVGIGLEAGVAEGGAGPLPDIAPETAVCGLVGGHLPFHLGGQAPAGPAAPGIGLPPAQVRRATSRPRARCCRTSAATPPCPPARRPICSTCRGARRPSSPWACCSHSQPAGSQARGGRSRRRRRTRRTASSSRAGHRSRIRARPPRAPGARCRGVALPAFKPRRQRVAGSHSGSRTSPAAAAA